LIIFVYTTVITAQKFVRKDLNVSPIPICTTLKINKKAIFCNNSKLEYADFNGYVVDSNPAVGTNHLYIINSENVKCKSERSKTTFNYENSGYDATSNAFIQCNNNNYSTVSA